MNTDPSANVSGESDYALWGPLGKDDLDKCFHRYLRHHAVTLGVDEADRRVRRLAKDEFIDVVRATNSELATLYPDYADLVRGYWGCIHDHPQTLSKVLCKKANAASERFRETVGDLETLRRLYVAFMDALARVAPLTRDWDLHPQDGDPQFNEWQAKSIQAFLSKWNGDVLARRIEDIADLRLNLQFPPKTPPDLVKTVERLRQAQDAVRKGEEPKWQPAKTLSTPPDVSRRKQPPIVFDADLLAPQHAPDTSGDDGDELEQLGELGLLEELELSEREREVVSLSLRIRHLDLDMWWGREHQRLLREAGFHISHEGLRKMGTRIKAKAQAAGS